MPDLITSHVLKEDRHGELGNYSVIEKITLNRYVFVKNKHLFALFCLGFIAYDYDSYACRVKGFTSVSKRFNFRAYYLRT